MVNQSGQVTRGTRRRGNAISASSVPVKGYTSRTTTVTSRRPGVRVNVATAPSDQSGGFGAANAFERRNGLLYVSDIRGGGLTVDPRLREEAGSGVRSSRGNALGANGSP